MVGFKCSKCVRLWRSSFGKAAGDFEGIEIVSNTQGAVMLRLFYCYLLGSSSGHVLPEQRLGRSLAVVFTETKSHEDSNGFIDTNLLVLAIWCRLTNLVPWILIYIESFRDRDEWIATAQYHAR